MLLQILDDGRLTDSHGRTVDFKNVVVIMTSNVGSSRILEQSGGFEDRDGPAYARMREGVLEDLRAQFRPEFLNRVDDTVVFHGLTEKHLGEIVEILLGRLRQRLEDREITLELTDAARRHLTAVGYDPLYGARPLKRVLQRELETELGRQILAGSIPDRSAVKVDFREGKLAFEPGSIDAAA